MTHTIAERLAADSAALQARLAHVPAPAGSVAASDWEDDGGEVHRLVRGHAWGVPMPNTDHSTISIFGVQYEHRPTEWWIATSPIPSDITPAAASDYGLTMMAAVKALEDVHGVQIQVNR